MNYTTNYHLPQWAETDRIMMEDFNQAFSDIDEGLEEVRSSAHAEAAAAQAAAEKLPYVVGMYIGDGTASQTITLGFEPSFVIVSGLQAAAGDFKDREGLVQFVIYGGVGSHYLIQGTATGFTVLKKDTEATTYWPRLNESNRRYYYIAFR